MINFEYCLSTTDSNRSQLNYSTFNRITMQILLL